MKEYSISLVIREMQIVTLIPGRKAKVKTTSAKTKNWQREVGSDGRNAENCILCTLDGRKDCRMVQEPWKIDWQLFYKEKNNIGLLEDPPIVLLGIYFRKVKPYIHKKKTCM